MSAGALVIVAIGILLGVGVPVLTMRMLAPSLAQGRLTENYRGRPVFAGLGVAWLVWAGAAIVMGVIGAGAAGEQSLLPLLTLAGPLALVCFALGIVDDAYGTTASRGFRGHLGALRQGRLTTGALKLLGISAASVVASLVVTQAGGVQGTATQVLLAVPTGAAIALTANFVNLTDLRPARALKVYSVLALLGVVSTVLGLGAVVDADWASRALDAIVLALFVLGPVFATWSYDAGERGMLGDAGANAAGAVAGLVIVAGLPPVAMLAYLALMLGLNVASERFSFSRVIEENRLLRSIDQLGRLPEDGESVQNDPHSETNPE